jgi:hypothetical protein
LWAFAVESSDADAGVRFTGYEEQGETQEQKLLYHLLKHYERAVRPVRNASHTITVKLGLTLTNIFDMVSLQLHSPIALLLSTVHPSSCAYRSRKRSAAHFFSLLCYSTC